MFTRRLVRKPRRYGVWNEFFNFRSVWFLPLDKAVASRVVFVIISGSDGRKRFCSQPNNSKAVRDRYKGVNRELIGTHGCTIECAHPWPLTPQTGGGGSKNSPFKFQPTDLRLTKMSRRHILRYIGWLWSDVMNNCITLAKVPKAWKQIEHNMCGHRAADHHCGGDLVSKLGGLGIWVNSESLKIWVLVRFPRKNF